MLLTRVFGGKAALLRPLGNWNHNMDNALRISLIKSLGHMLDYYDIASATFLPPHMTPFATTQLCQTALAQHPPSFTVRLATISLPVYSTPCSPFVLPASLSTCTFPLGASETTTYSSFQKAGVTALLPEDAEVLEVTNILLMIAPSSLKRKHEI
jgi:hypothetical protein